MRAEVRSGKSCWYLIHSELYVPEQHLTEAVGKGRLLFLHAIKELFPISAK